MGISQWIGGSLFSTRRKYRRTKQTKLMVQQLETRTLFAVTFGVPIEVDAGVGPTAVARGDFNGDGLADIAVANTGLGRIGVLLGNGTGTFADMATYNTASGPQSIAIGDFDRDGIADLAVACVNADVISLLFGNADGSFDGAVNVNVGDAPTDVLTSDLNHDGFLDLIVANSGVDNTVGVLLGGANGTFSAMTTTSTHAGPTKMVQGDFNRDGAIDIVVTNNSATTIDMLTGNGNGTFDNAVATVVATLGNTPLAITTNDFNRDGRQDVAVTLSSAQVAVLLGDGTGTFGVATNYNVGAGPIEIISGDIDRDGKPDLIVSSSTTDSINVLLGTAIGAFGAATAYPVGDTPTGLALGDFIANSGLDLVVANNGDGNITLLPNATGGLQIPSRLSITQQPTDVAAGTAISPGVIVEVDDAAGNIVLTANNNLTAVIVSGPTGGAIIGTATAKAVNGQAIFDNLKFSKTGTYTVKFASTGLTSATADTFEVLAGAPAKVVITQQPATTIAGDTISNVIVQVQDAQGNLVTDDTSNVTIAVSTGPNGASPLDGTLTVAAVGGIATFNDLSLETAGNYTFVVTDGALTQAKSKSFTINPDAATAHLELLTQPADTVVGKALTPALVVGVVDQFGNLVKTGNPSITIAIDTGPGGAALSGTLTVKASGGKATFSNIKTDTAGNYTLSATAASLADPTPITFAQTVDKGQTVITQPKPAASYAFGQTITLNSTIKSDSPLKFTGESVDLIDNPGPTVITSAIANSSGALKFTPTGLVPGVYTMHLDYAGSDNFTAMTSPSDFTITITKAKTTVVLTTAPTSAFSGQDIVLTAKVNASTGGSTARTGNVVFKDNGNIIATVALDVNSEASFTDLAPATGTHKYTAEYVGDSNFLAGPAVTKNVTVKKNSVTGVLASDTPNNVPINTNFELSFQLTVKAPGSTVPTGDVTFKDGNTVLGTVALDGSGLATLTLQLANAGTHNIKAFYEGDDNTNALTSATLKVITA
jgi:hypothetical protein